MHPLYLTIAFFFYLCKISSLLLVRLHFPGRWEREIMCLCVCERERKCDAAMVSRGKSSGWRWSHCFFFQWKCNKCTLMVTNDTNKKDPFWLKLGIWQGKRCTAYSFCCSSYCATRLCPIIVPQFCKNAKVAAVQQNEGGAFENKMFY